MGLADTLIGVQQNTNQSLKSDPNALASGLQQGAQLALQAEQLTRAKENLLMQKEQLQLQKINSLGESYNIGLNIKDPRMQQLYFQKVVPAKANALGLNNLINPEVADMIAKTQEGKAKMQGLLLDVNSKVENGQLKGAAIAEYVASKTADPESFILYNGDSIADAQRFATKEAGDTAQAKIVAEGQDRRAYAAQANSQALKDKELGSAASRAVDSKFASTVVDWSDGGRATALSNLQQLRDAERDLRDSKVKTGGASSLAPDAAQDFINPKYAETRDKVRGAVQGSLRATLGPQFTAGEGEAIFNRAINPRLSPSENARRIKVEADKIEAQIRAKDAAVKHFQDNGTLEGFRGAVASTEGKTSPVTKAAEKVTPKAEKTYSVFGAQMTKAQADAFFKANPKLKKPAGL